MFQEIFPGRHKNKSSIESSKFFKGLNYSGKSRPKFGEETKKELFICFGGTITKTSFEIYENNFKEKFLIKLI